MAVMPVDGDEEAVRLINDSRYGLTSSVWTTDAEAALYIGDHIETGTWCMNRCDYLDPALAWTGVKDIGPRMYTLATRRRDVHATEVVPSATHHLSLERERQHRVHIGLLACDEVAERFRHVAGGYQQMFERLLSPHIPDLRVTRFDLQAGRCPRTRSG